MRFCSTTVALLVIAFSMAARLRRVYSPAQRRSIVVNVIRLAGIDINEAAGLNTQVEKFLLERFPDEIQSVWSRIGSAEVATDPMGIELTDIYFDLYPREHWTRAQTQAELVEQIENDLADFPGMNLAFSQPIELRFNELITGIRSDIGIKIYGDDLDELVRLSEQVQQVLATIDGAADVSGEQVTGQPSLKIKVDQNKIARYGIPARHVLDVVSAIGNRRAGEIYEGQRSYPLVMRLPDQQREDIDAIAKTLIPTDSGPVLPLEAVTNIELTAGPSTINREWGRRRFECSAMCEAGCSILCGRCAGKDHGTSESAGRVCDQLGRAV